MAPTRYLSICSGIEAASVAWDPLGWEPLAFAEIEPFPRAVLAHHYPSVPLHGDFTRLRDEAWIGAADVLVGGTPCQAFSVAGKRASLSDDRGNLTLEFVRLADAIDDVRRLEGRAPSVLVWENVPGVLSVKDNAFGCFLAALVGEDDPIIPPGGKWTNAGVVAGPQRQAAWRTLDAQYFGLAQRRRRVFVVASAREGFDPTEVLLEWEGVRRDTPPSREAGKAAARSAGPSAAGGGERSHWDGDYPHPTLNQSAAGAGGVRLSNQEVFSQRGAYLAAAQAFGGNNTSGPIDVAPTLLAQPGSGYKGDFDSETFVAEVAGTPPAGGAQAKSAGTATGQDAAAGLLVASATGNITHALTVSDGATEDGTGRGTPIVAFDTTQITSPSNYSNPKPGDPWHPLAAGAHPPCVAFSAKDHGADAGEIAPTLRAMGHGASHANGGGQVAVAFDIHGVPATAGASPTDVHTPLRARAPGGSEASTTTVALAFQASQSGVRVADTHATLDANNGSHRHNGVVAPTITSANDPSRSPQSSEITAQVAAVAAASMAVRRLTPRECERLQGFPDDYTRIAWKKKLPEECPDGPRYKALGNSMAVPCMRWIGVRVAAEITRHKESAQ